MKRLLGRTSHGPVPPIHVETINPDSTPKLSACLTEYVRLWEEVRAKWATQQQLTNQIVYLAAGLVTVSWFILDGKSSHKGEDALIWAERVWLAAPILFSTLSLLVAYHDRGIRQIARYVYEWLRPVVEDEVRRTSPRALDPHIWHWDVFWYPELGLPQPSRGPRTTRTQDFERFTDLVYSAAKYGLAFMISAVSLILWAIQADSRGFWNLWWVAFVADSIIVLGVLGVGAFEQLRYLDIRRVAREHQAAARA